MRLAILSLLVRLVNHSTMPPFPDALTEHILYNISSGSTHTRKKNHDRGETDFITECSALKCSHECDIDFKGQPHCYCPEGYDIEEDNETCTPIGNTCYYM